jgi:transaldolase
LVQQRHNMKLYLDTANTSEWDKLFPLGLFEGITTNPLLAQRAGLNYAEIDWHAMYARACDLGAKELHVQVYGDPNSYADWAKRIYEISHNVGIDAVIKVPLVEPALRIFPAIKALGGKTLLTACYDSKQALIAHALGADYVAPYLGRMRDQGLNDLEQLATMNKLTQSGPCSVLAASIRSAAHLVEIGLQGTDCATFSPNVVRELIIEDSSTSAWQEFENTIAALT